MNAVETKITKPVVEVTKSDKVALKPGEIENPKYLKDQEDLGIPANLDRRNAQDARRNTVPGEKAYVQRDADTR